MDEKQFFEKLNEFCAKNKFDFLWKFHAGSDICVAIIGKNCIKPFDEWLASNTQSHTPPFLDKTEVISYIKL